MLVLTIFFAGTSAFFTALLETNIWLSANQPLPKQGIKQVFPSLLGPVLFSVIYLHNHFVIQLISGLLFIFISFAQLGIIKFKKEFAYYFTVHFLLICAISALNGLAWQQAVWGPISFLFLTPPLIFISRKLSKFSGKSRENVNELLELTGIVNSIFIFIIGLVIASDRVRFLKKIVNWIFN
ncbi:MAG: hypothetical protein D8M58_05815 [Calditrichaeota bacterium]|nr:MAG: hypothetical protein DWQ03_20690 [Calditrichota bacterium]MBL1204894.1 hypothetical protein [Calditrichota bacterium]NOG44723.1 hypothetical protein [Calditrichota bacterium]